MLEEIRCELGLLLKDVKDTNSWYPTVSRLLKEKMSHYQSIIIYLTDDSSFYFFDDISDEEEIHHERVPFGEEMLSVVAARGEISCDFTPIGQKIYIPFYHGHHLLGEMIVQTSQFVDDDELKFMKNIQSILSLTPF